MSDINLKPKKRSKARLITGKYYYRCKRTLFWMTRDIKFSIHKESIPFKYAYITHSTPLIRQLLL